MQYIASVRKAAVLHFHTKNTVVQNCLALKTASRSFPQIYSNTWKCFRTNEYFVTRARRIYNTRRNIGSTVFSQISVYAFCSTPRDNVVARARIFGLIANYTNRAISPLKETPGGRRGKKGERKKAGGRRGERGGGGMRKKERMARSSVECCTLNSTVSIFQGADGAL